MYEAQKGIQGGDKKSGQSTLEENSNGHCDPFKELTQ